MSKTITEYFKPVGAKRMTNSSLQPNKAKEKIKKAGSKHDNYSFVLLVRIRLKLLRLLQRMV